MTPAVVEDRYTNVLAAKSLAVALAPYYAVGTNLVRATFLDPRLRDMYQDWETITGSGVAGLRSLIGPDVDDPRLNELIGELAIYHAEPGSPSAQALALLASAAADEREPVRTLDAD